MILFYACAGVYILSSIWAFIGTLIGFNLLYGDCTVKSTAHIIGITPVEFNYCLAIFEYKTRFNNTLLGTAPVVCSNLEDFDMCYCAHRETLYSINLESYFPNYIAECVFYSGVVCSLFFTITTLLLSKILKKKNTLIIVNDECSIP